MCTIFHALHIKKILKCVTDHTAVLIQTSESRQFCLRLQLPLRMLESSASIAHACIATEAEENCNDSQECELNRDPDAFLIFFYLIIYLKPYHLKCHLKERTCPRVLTHAFRFCTVPKMQFKERVYTCSENDARVAAVISRSGDVQHRSSVRCYTRQASAQVMMDFEERPNTDASVVTFLPGMYELGN